MENEIFKLSLREARMIRAICIKSYGGSLRNAFFSKDDPNIDNGFALFGLINSAAKLLNIDIGKKYNVGDNPEFDSENLTFTKNYGIFIYWWEHDFL